MCGILSAGSAGAIGTTSPGIQPSPSMAANSRPARGHQLHADADAEKRPAAADDRLCQAPRPCRAPPPARACNRRRRRRRAARSRSARRTTSASRGHLHPRRQAPLRAPRARTPWRPSADCPSRNRSIAVDISRLPPSTPLVEGTASACARVDRHRLAQGARQPLVAGFDDVVVVLAVEILDVQRHPGGLGEGLEPFLEQLGVHLAELGLARTPPSRPDRAGSRRRARRGSASRPSAPAPSPQRAMPRGRPAPWPPPRR